MAVKPEDDPTAFDILASLSAHVVLTPLFSLNTPRTSRLKLSFAKIMLLTLPF
jgi:hypothetical protein